MGVNSFNKILRSATTKLVAAIVTAFGVVFFLAAFITDRSEGEVISKRVNIAVRAIGHDLLLRAGDSTSIVLPVIETSSGVFRLTFKNEFVFQPDTLVAIVQRFLTRTELSHYTVTVQECYTPAIVYGFEINPPGNNITPCGGRTQPKACYHIEIAFADFPKTTGRYIPLGILIGGGVPLMIAMVLIGRNFSSQKKSVPPTPKNIPVENEGKPFLTLGRFVFDSTNQHLILGEETIVLTDKECKILTSLGRNIGRLTLREELIQEVWTDEGVITGRSLDMFISKLRKKLTGDPHLRITNVHGKGYRLEMVDDFSAS